MKMNNETKIGLMVTVVLLILFGLTLKSGKFNFSKKGYTILVNFNNVDGVNLNSPVMVNGFEVGLVEDIHIKDEGGITKIELVIGLKEEVRLRKTTKAIVKLLGFMGEKYVGLIAGNEGDFLKDGDSIVGEEPANFDDIVRNGTAISAELKEVAKQLNQLLANNSGRVDKILISVNETIDNLASISGNIDERLNKNDENFDALILNLKGVSVNLEEMSADLKKNPWKILYKSKKE